MTKVLPPDEANELIGRILERWKRREAELRGRSTLTDIHGAKADGIADCHSELTIHRPSITSGRTYDNAKIPEIDASRFTLGELSTALSSGELRLPVWIRIGRAGYRITEENKDAICRGLLIALELKTQS